MNTIKTIPFAERNSKVPVSFIREILKAASQKNLISFAGGLPNPSLFPVTALANAAQHVFINQGVLSLQYANTEGYWPLRKYISERYRQRKRLEIPPENILITNGSQQALDLIGKAFLDKGDHVLLERPSYLGAIQCLSMFEPIFHEVELRADGVDMPAFKDKLDHFPIKLFYCIPNYQNPTGTMYSTQKRLEIAKYIKKHQTIVIEDDPYGDLCFDRDQPDPIKSFNDDQVIHLGSFSKVVSPGMRIGWIAASKPIIDRLTIMKQASDLHTNQLSQMILLQYLSSNSLQDHIDTICASYAAQKKKMVELLKTHLPSGVTFVEPKGGMFLWLQLPMEMDASELLKNAIEWGVLYVPGEHFYALTKAKNTLRLNFSNASLDEIESGVKSLCKVIQRKCLMLV